MPKKAEEIVFPITMLLLEIMPNKLSAMICLPQDI
jgi:hypothetical protein